MVLKCPQYAYTHHTTRAIKSSRHPETLEQGSPTAPSLLDDDGDDVRDVHDEVRASETRARFSFVRLVVSRDVFARRARDVRAVVDPSADGPRRRDVRLSRETRRRRASTRARRRARVDAPTDETIFLIPPRGFARDEDDRLTTRSRVREPSTAPPPRPSPPGRA